MSGSAFQIPDSMLYTYPTKLEDGDLHYVEFQPKAGSSFVAGNSFDITLTSPDSIIVPSKSYLQFKVTVSGLTSEGSFHATGLSSAIQTITTSLGGVELESIQNYNLLHAMLVKRSTSTYQKILSKLEWSSATPEATTGSTIGNSALTANMALRIGLFEGHNQYIPLPWIRGGVNLNFTLAPNSVFFCKRDAANAIYTVTDVRMVCAMLKPSNAYLQSFTKSLESGSLATIPLQVTRNIRFQPTTSTTQESVLSVGYLSSVRSILGAYRGTAVPSDTTSASSVFASESLNNLSEFYWQIGSERYPKNRTIKCGSTNFENLMQALVSVDNTYNHLNAVAAAGTGDLVFFQFASNPSFGSGVAIPDGILRFNHNYSSAPTSTGMVELFYVYDTVIRLGSSDITIDSRSV